MCNIIVSIMKRGFLIAFTGIDGSGKTTQGKLLEEVLKHKGEEISYVWSRWDSFLLRPLIKRWKNCLKSNTFGHNFNNKIKKSKQKILNNPIFCYAWLALFFLEYSFQIFIKVRILLAKKMFIISDRTFYDSIIDQAINLGKWQDFLLDTLDSFWIRILFPKPDMVIYIDCPENIAFSRKTDLPSIEYLIERRALYLKLADKYAWFKVDGTLSINEIYSQIRNKVYSKFGI